MTVAAKVSWPQVLAWRLHRQSLDPPGTSQTVEIVRRLCGVQAQIASAAEQAIGVRQVEPRPGQAEQALADRALMKTWAMRGTLHLLPPDTAGAYLALAGAARSWEKASWQKAFGVTPAELAALADAVYQALDDRALTREELVAEVAAETANPELEEQLRSGWGAVLKPIAWQGKLCHGPSQGNRISFARPDGYLPGWGGVPAPEEAAGIAIPAYLGAYGPATADGFDSWLTRGVNRKKQLRGWFADLGDELATVEVDGEPRYLCAAHVDELAATKPTRTVRLLPAFDQYVLGPGTGAAEVIAPERRALVSKTAGWISPVVVAGGRVTGTWETADGELRVSLFTEGGEVDRDALEAETARIAALTGADLTLAVARH